MGSPQALQGKTRSEFWESMGEILYCSSTFGVYVRNMLQLWRLGAALLTACLDGIESILQEGLKDNSR